MSTEQSDDLSEVIDNYVEDFRHNLKLRVAEIMADGAILSPQQLVRKARQLYLRKERERNGLRDALIGLGATGIGITLTKVGESVTSEDYSVHLFFVIVGLLGVVCFTIGLSYDP